MADVHIDISKDEDANFALFGGSVFELTVGSFSVSMNADQFQQLCDNLRPWIVDDTEQAPPAAAVSEPIAELLKQYEREGCDFSDVAWVKQAAMRYVKTMPDSQVRCLLYVLAQAPTAPSGGLEGERNG